MELNKTKKKKEEEEEETASKHVATTNQLVG
jgi:hypothetical protein